MSPYASVSKKLCLVVLMGGLFAFSSSSAARGVGGLGGGDRGSRANVGTFNNDGSYNRGDNINNENYRRNNDYYGADGAVVIGDPGASCTTTQECDDYGNCSENQICN